MASPAILRKAQLAAQRGQLSAPNFVRGALNRQPYTPDLIRQLVRDQTVNLGGAAPNPWMTALTAMQQGKGDPNWRPGRADQREYNTLVSDVEAVNQGAELFPSHERMLREAQDFQDNWDLQLRTMEQLRERPGNPAVGAASNPGAMGQITGVSPGAIGVGTGMLSMGVPGIAGAVSSTLGHVASQGIPAVGVPALSEDLSITTESGPLGITSANMPSSIISAIVSAIMGHQPTFQATPTAAVPDEDMSVTGSGPANAGWTETTQLTSHPGDPGQAGATPGAPGSPGEGATGGPPGDSGAPSGGGGPGGAPSSGGEGESMRRGGKIKGIGPKKITAHGGEFIMNPKASSRFDTLLSGLNKAVPADKKSNGRGNSETIDSLLRRARTLITGDDT